MKRGKETTIAEVIQRNTGMSTQDFLKEIRNPFLYNLKETCAFIKAHLDGQVTIVGDYDSDGINATAILSTALAMMGVIPKMRLPRRFSEGYGLSEKIVDEIDSGLMITVDNGIAAAKAVTKAKEKGLFVVVTDHHLPPLDEDGNMILPTDADIILDPHIEEQSEFHDYCGAGLALRMAQELLPDKKLKKLVILAGIATITDIMPLTGANRTLVKDSLEYINKGLGNSGLKALIPKLGLELGSINETDYGFSFGPVFNASGRLYDNGADKVLRAILSTEDDPRLDARVTAIVTTNEKRKTLMKSYNSQADNAIKKIIDGKSPIVIFNSEFGEGFIGLVAGSLCEKHHCPVIVFTRSEKEGILKGSGRSIEGYHLRHILDKMQNLIVGYGGHAGAAGLSIREADLDAFTTAFKSECGHIPEYVGSCDYDLELDAKDIADAIKELKVFAPYGEGNPKPIFKMTYTPKSKVEAMGDGSHFQIKEDGFTIVAFGKMADYKAKGEPKTLNMVGTLSESTYKGKVKYKFEVLNLL